MISVFELFKIGIGPSSSHTVGPMVAAKRFRDAVEAGGAPVAAITAETYGSLAWTGRGHGTDLAIGLGLLGASPGTVDPDAAFVHFDRFLTGLPAGVQVFSLLLANPRRVLTRSQILEQVWGYDFPTTGNALEVYIGYLRRKTEADGELRLIHTVRGVGYVLRESPP